MTAQPHNRFVFCVVVVEFAVKPGLRISRKDRKHRLENMFLSFPAVAWSLYGSNDHRHWSLTRNICNQCAENFKILFEASSQACSAILTTIWRPGLNGNQGLSLQIHSIKTRQRKSCCCQYKIVLIRCYKWMSFQSAENNHYW